MAATCAPGCGGERSSEPASVAGGDLLSAAAPGQIVVAEVDGLPVYGACLQAQRDVERDVERDIDRDIDRQTALERCIEFELLAQEAQRRGLARHPDVVAMGRKEAVRALLDQHIVAPMPTPEQTDRSILVDAYKRYRDRIYAPERRRIFHLFAPFAKHRERPGTDDDRRARAFADELHAALVAAPVATSFDRRGLTPDAFYDIAKQVAGDRPLGPTDEATGEFKREIFKVYRDQPNLPRGFSHAAMDIPKPGMVSGPARSDYGWHIILYIDGEPARFADVESAAEYLFQTVRSERYWNFTGQLLKNADIAVNEAALERMQEREEELLGGAGDGAGGGSRDRASRGAAP